MLAARSLSGVLQKIIYLAPVNERVSTFRGHASGVKQGCICLSYSTSQYMHSERTGAACRSCALATLTLASTDTDDLNLSQSMLWLEEAAGASAGRAAPGALRLACGGACGTGCLHLSQTAASIGQAGQAIVYSCCCRDACCLLAIAYLVPCKEQALNG